MSAPDHNVDAATVEGFGAEWRSFDQRSLSDEELRRAFDEYFDIFPWDRIPEGAEGFDAGCGSGRWARFVAPRVGMLHCVDASGEALDVARSALADEPNCFFHHVSLADMPFAPCSMDFGYALGVLHHLPDTAAGLRSCVEVLRPGAPLLIYLYYALDGRPWWYRMLWRVSDLLRRGVSQLPHTTKQAVSTVVAALVYWPLARAARQVERTGRRAENLPLAYYRHRSFYTMRTDAHDRLGTRLEKRFTADQVRAMMKAAGLTDIRLSPDPPFWCAVGFRQ